MGQNLLWGTATAAYQIEEVCWKAGAAGPFGMLFAGFRAGLTK